MLIDRDGDRVRPSTGGDGPHWIAGALALAAIAAPTFYPPNAPPLTSLQSESWALLAWGLFLTYLVSCTGALAMHRAGGRSVALSAVLLALALLLASILASVVFAGLPVAIGLRHGFVLLSAGAALLAGAAALRSQPPHFGASLLESVLLCLLFAGLGNAAIAVLQTVGITGWWPPLGKDGRAIGALYQPNLLGTQLLWAFAALVALYSQRRLPRWLALVFAALLILAITLSASRTAAVSCLVLAVWGIVDKRLDRESRLALVASPLLLVLGWAALLAVQDSGGPGFAGTELLHKADPTSARWGLWAQCAKLVAAHPWLGVGWGQFNFAWTLTPMPGLPRTAGYTFTHAHNLFVQWAVELGLPLTLILTSLLAFALLRCVGRLRRGHGDVPVVQRAALAMVLIVLVHSQLESPLWWVYLLLPTAFLLGVALPAAAPASGGHKPKTALLLVPLLMVAGASFALWDYRAVAEIYRPSPNAPSQELRIQTARQSLLFGQFGDRIAGTLAPAGQRRLDVFQHIVFEMLDERLLMSWALALAENGQIDKARFLADRLREFDSPSARQFFAVCVAQPHRFQCQRSPAAFELADFRF